MSEIKTRQRIRPLIYRASADRQEQPLKNDGAGKNQEQVQGESSSQNEREN
jgi:hypothetical protein